MALTSFRSCTRAPARTNKRSAVGLCADLKSVPTVFALFAERHGTLQQTISAKRPLGRAKTVNRGLTMTMFSAIFCCTVDIFLFSALSLVSRSRSKMSRVGRVSEVHRGLSPQYIYPREKLWVQARARRG